MGGANAVTYRCKAGTTLLGRRASRTAFGQSKLLIWIRIPRPVRKWFCRLRLIQYSRLLEGPAVPGLNFPVYDSGYYLVIGTEHARPGQLGIRRRRQSLAGPRTKAYK